MDLQAMGRSSLMHKSDPQAAFVLGQLSVPEAYSPQTSRLAEDKGKEMCIKQTAFIGC